LLEIDIRTQGLGADFPGSRVAAVVLAQIPYQLVKLRAKLKEQDNAGKGRRPKALKAVTVNQGMPLVLFYYNYQCYCVYMSGVDAATEAYSTYYLYEQY
jgi:hypothetical protein